MSIKEKDFIEIEYTGKIKEDNIIFDTTDEKTAKDNNIYNEQMAYKPIIICVGQGQLIKGLDHQIIGKEIGKEHTFEINPEGAFGKKSAKLLKMVSASVFKKQNIQPMPGLQVNMDGIVGVIRTVTGGRVIVDFNHPLSGKDLVYQVKIIKLITDDKLKIESFINLELGFKPEKIEIEKGNAKVILNKQQLSIVENNQDKIADKLVEIIEQVKQVKFEEKTEEKETVKKEEKEKPKETKEKPVEKDEKGKEEKKEASAEQPKTVEPKQ